MDRINHQREDQRKAQQRSIDAARERADRMAACAHTRLAGCMCMDCGKIVRAEDSTNGKEGAST